MLLGAVREATSVLGAGVLAAGVQHVLSGAAARVRHRVHAGAGRRAAAVSARFRVRSAVCRRRRAARERLTRTRRRRAARVARGRALDGAAPASRARLDAAHGARHTACTAALPALRARQDAHSFERALPLLSSCSDCCVMNSLIINIHSSKGFNGSSGLRKRSHSFRSYVPFTLRFFFCVSRSAQPKYSTCRRLKPKNYYLCRKTKNHIKIVEFG